MMNKPENFNHKLCLEKPIRLAIRLIEKFLENNQIVQIKFNSFETACYFLQSVLYKMLQNQLDPNQLQQSINQKILDIRHEVLPNDFFQRSTGEKKSVSKTLGSLFADGEATGLCEDIIRTLLNANIYKKFEEEYEEMFMNIARMFAAAYLTNPQKVLKANFCFIGAIIANIKHKVIYVRWDTNDTSFEFFMRIIKQVITEVNNHLSSQAPESNPLEDPDNLSQFFGDSNTMAIENAEIDVSLFHYIVEQLIDACYSRELVHLCGAALCIERLFDHLPTKYFLAHYTELLMGLFNLLQVTPEIIELPLIDTVYSLVKKLAKIRADALVHNQAQYKTIINMMASYMTSAHTYQHLAACCYVEALAKELNVENPALFFYADSLSHVKSAEQIFEPHHQCRYTRAQNRESNLPISKIIKAFEAAIIEIPRLYVLHKEHGHYYTNKLRNCLNTINFLQKNSLLFCTMVDEENNSLTSDFYYLTEICFKIIEDNDKIYQALSYVITDASDMSLAASTSGGNMSHHHGSQDPNHMEEEKKMERPHPQPSGQANYCINRNILYDDDEFNLNIEDVDLNVQAWAKLISSAMNLLQDLVTHRLVSSAMKYRQARRDSDPDTIRIIETRNKIIFKFFNMMLRIERSIRRTATKGLKALIRLENQPKDLLTEDKLKIILRPILICLQQEYQKFNMPFLNILRKLIKFLNQCFNKTLGEKLIDHLTKLIENFCRPTSRGPYTESGSDERKLAMGILYLFEHLPHAIQSLDTIIKLSQKIENAVVVLNGQQYMANIIRRPLLKIVNSCPSGSINFFTTNLSDSWKTFIAMLKDDSSHSIRERLSRDTELFLDRTFPIDSQVTNPPDSPYKAIRIIRVITKRNPRWLLTNRILIDHLLKYWRTKTIRQQTEDELFKDHFKDETSQIIKTFVLYCQNNRSEIKVLFEIVQIYNIRTSYNFSFVDRFFRYYLPEHYTPAQKRKIFIYFLNVVFDSKVPMETKVHANYYMIYPMLLLSFKKGQAREIFDQSLIEKIHKITEELSVQDPSRYGRLEIEILQIIGLLITYMPEEFFRLDIRMKLIKIGWICVKCDNKVYSNIGKIFVCKFIKQYDLPLDKIYQLYVALVKGQEYMSSNDHDVKLLSRRALDILIPHLPKVEQAEQQLLQQQQQQQQQQSGESMQIEQSNSQQMQIEKSKTSGLSGRSGSSSAAPKWVQWTCRIINEDNYNDYDGRSFARFWQVFIRMHKIFSKYKQFFTTQLINSMQLLIITHNSDIVCKKTAIDLGFIYIEWQYQDLREKFEKCQTKAEKLKILHDIGMEESKDIFTNFFVKMALSSCTEKDDRESISRKSLYLLKKQSILWPDTTKKYSSIEKATSIFFHQQQQQQQIQPQMQNTQKELEKVKYCHVILVILSILTEFDTPENIINNFELIFKLLSLPNSNCFTCDNPYIIQLSANLIRRLLHISTLGNNNQTIVQKFVELIEKGVKQYLQAFHARSKNNQSLNQEFVKNMSVNIYTAIRISRVLFEHKNDILDPFFGDLMEICKIFTELFLKHIPQAKMMSKNSSTSPDGEDLLANMDTQYTEEGFENLKFSYYNLREFVIILSRILASRLVTQKEPDKKAMLINNCFEVVLEKFSDFDFVSEVVSILKGLLLKDAYDDVKSIITPQKGVFTMQEKIGFFLDPKKVIIVLERFQEPANERLLKNYSCMIVDLLRSIPHQELSTRTLRRLTFGLIRWGHPEAIHSLFEHLEEIFGNNVDKKFMFFLFELSEDDEYEDALPDDLEELHLMLSGYLLYSYAARSKTEVTRSQIPAFFIDKNQGKYDIMQIEQLGSQAQTADLCSKVAKFLDFINGKYTDFYLICELRRLIMIDYPLKAQILNDFLVDFLKSVWDTCPKQIQQNIGLTVEKFITSFKITPSSAAVLVKFYSKIYTEKTMKPGILQHVAKTSNTWWLSLNQLERIADDGGGEQSEEAIFAINELYSRLDEKDYTFGLKHLISDHPLVSRGVTLLQHRQWVKADKAFSSYLQQVDYSPDSITDVLDKKVSEECWVATHKQMNDWGVIQAIVRDHSREAAVECAWYRKDIQAIDDFLHKDQSENALTYLFKVIENF